MFRLRLVLFQMFCLVVLVIKDDYRIDGLVERRGMELDEINSME